MGRSSYVDFEEVFKFTDSGLVPLIHETSDYLRERERQGRPVDHVEFDDTKDGLLIFRLWD